MKLSHGLSVSGQAGPAATQSPLLTNLQLFCDYENWAAGDPLPNRFPNHSGITSLTDNNTVGAETASALVGTKSGHYVRSNSEYHSHADTQSISVGVGEDIYMSAWVRVDTTSNVTFWGHFDNGTAGYLFRVRNLEFEMYVVNSSDGNQFLKTGQDITVGDVYFVEAWYTRADTTIHLRFNDGSPVTGSANPPDPASVPLELGARSGGAEPLDGLIDNAMIEIAPQGELAWPNHSTWLYNGGAGRSWSEIKNYNP